MQVLRKVLLMTVAGLPLTAAANSIQKPLDQVHWHFSGDRFACQMETPLEFDGKATVQVRSGQQPQLTLKTFQRPYFIDTSWLNIKDEPWKAAGHTLPLMEGRSRGKEEIVFKDRQNIKTLLNKMEKGAWAQVSVQYDQHQQIKTWDLPTVNFSTSLQEMKACMTNLLPMDYPQAKDNLFHFPSGASELTLEQKLRIADVASYILHDTSVTNILVDGHTDDSGSSLHNLGLARERALAVVAELKRAGVDSTQVQLRAHGNRYPLKANNSSANRELNRRVQLRIVKGDTTRSTKA